VTIKRRSALFAIFALTLVVPVRGATPWDFAMLSRAPNVHEAETKEPGVRALYFESVHWRGKPTRVFAYYGAPAGKKLPAMVLIHGGGGTAFAEWVRLWNKRGYAAIAVDTCGNVPDRVQDDKPWSPSKKHHELGGPEGWGGFAQIDEPIADQWTYHAVAAAILAHSLIRSFPEVDPKRIGVTGISWGGYLTDIVSGVDPRFRFAVPVYGCGFLGEDSAWGTSKNWERNGRRNGSPYGTPRYICRARRCRCFGSPGQMTSPIRFRRYRSPTGCQQGRDRYLFASG
jgi:dienelactone hydrolase